MIASPIPSRSSSALSGWQLARELEKLSPGDREERIYREVTSGNVPRDLHFWNVSFDAVAGGHTVRVMLLVLPDYIRVGSSRDSLYIPMRPRTAQRIADRFDCGLPTPKMVDIIASHANLLLEPWPLRPSKEMTTLPVFETHNQLVRGQLEAAGYRPGNGIVAGIKKDIVICAGLASHPGHVALYGWHSRFWTASRQGWTGDPVPIQPLYLGHLDSWADYSHGVRLISRTMYIDHVATRVETVLADPKLCVALSDEGPLMQTRYDVSSRPSRPVGPSK